VKGGALRQKLKVEVKSRNSKGVEEVQLCGLGTEQWRFRPLQL